MGTAPDQAAHTTTIKIERPHGMRVAAIANSLESLEGDLSPPALKQASITGISTVPTPPERVEALRERNG